MTTNYNDPFDLEQRIIECWNVTSDFDILLEELNENGLLDKDKASNFVLGLTTIYTAKFERLFRTFEEFLKTFYAMRDERDIAQKDCYDLSDLSREVIPSWLAGEEENTSLSGFSEEEGEENY